MQPSLLNRKARLTVACLIVGVSIGAGSTPAAAQVLRIVVSGTGEITPAVEQYRAFLGEPDNGSAPGPQPKGRREITWDGVPDEFAAPNFLPADFFSAAIEPRARGLLLSTPGTGLLVSADSDNPANAAVRFGHINPGYSAIFKAFSGERLFSPIGSNVVDVTFAVPGTQTPALVRGFGAVYTDIDTNHTAFEYFDRNGRSLGQFTVPIANNGLSFLGVAFDQPIIARVRVAYGTVPLGPDDSLQNDVAVMDNFIYGEPLAMP